MSDQPDNRREAESTREFEDDIRGVLVAIEQDPYDEGGHVIETFERWAADDSIDVEQFATAGFRVLRARERALSELR